MADEKPADEQAVPGRFEHPPEPYKGYLSFPNPLTYNHFTAWWREAIQPMKDLTALDYDHWNGVFQGAVALLDEYGEWDIRGPLGPVPKGSLKDGNLPLILEEWVCVCARAYIFPMLDPKKRAMLLTLF